MLSKQFYVIKAINFFFRSLVMLLVVNFCFFSKATAQSDVPQLIRLPIEQFVPDGFIVYGKAPIQENAGIVSDVRYRQTTDPLPDLEPFFEFGGTLELVTTSLFLTKHDLVISEIMWGLDENYPTEGEHTYTQWIEIYNAYPGVYFTPQLFLLFTPLKDYPDRHIVEFADGQRGLVLDAVSNLHLGRWDMPGRSGRRPFSDVVSAYRNIIYPDGANPHQNQSIVPFGSYKESWNATPKRGRRNTLLNAIDNFDRVIKLPYIATPGTRHVPDRFLRAITKIPVQSDRVVINEVRNDISHDNLDWIELKNVSRSTVQLENWELSIVTGVGEDTDLVDLPAYEMAPGEILLLQARHPKFTVLADGINIKNPERLKTKGTSHKYFEAPGLNLPNTSKFTLLLRSESDKNGQDVAIEDYAGNGFFSDVPNTDFWPRHGQPRPTDIADFGNHGTFGSLNSAWARLRYTTDDGHHRSAWQRVDFQGGIGYVPRTDRSISLGTPGYENNALKTHIGDRNFGTSTTDRRYDSGEISISEIMYDAGPRRNRVQWIELYNSSQTQAVNLEGWELEIDNFQDDIVRLAKRRFIFNEAIILPNQTLLIVSKESLNNVIENRVYNLYQQHQRELRLSNRSSSLLNPSGFHLKLISKSDPQRSTDDIIVDEVGNLDEKNREPTKLWDLPAIDPEVRRSLVRQYGRAFRPNQDGRSRASEFAVVGTLREAWRQADNAHVSFTYYGNASDRGTPGHRLGSPLPVQLTNFRAELTTTGVVSISWVTESELDNAGFNILRSKTKSGAFKIVNPILIQGAGTSSERNTYHFVDTTAKPDAVYYYRIEDVSFAGNRQQLATIQMKGHISASDKFITTWGDIKSVK